jgi:hypothetical protein
MAAIRPSFRRARPVERLALTAGLAGLAVAFALAAPCEEASAGGGHEGAGAAGATFVAFDYIPNALYARDSLDVCVRAKLSPADARPGVTLKLTAADSDGKALKSFEWPLEPAELPPGGLRREASIGAVEWAAISVEVLRAGVCLARAEAVCVGEKGTIPKLAVSGEHLTDERGRIVVLRLERRTRSEDRSWVLLKRMSGTFAEGEAPASVAAFGSTLAETGSPLARALSAHGTRVTDLMSPPRELPAAPVLQSVAAVLQEAPRAQAGAAVLVLPPGDADCGTGSEEYRRLVEFMLVRLRAAGCDPVVLVGPVNFAAPPKRLAKYVETASQVAWANRAGFVDPTPALVEENFRIDPARAGACGRYPNEKGAEKLAGMILDELRKVAPSD